MAGAKDNDLLKKSSTSSWKTLLIGGIFGYVFAMMSIMHGDHYSSVGMRRLDEVILGSGDEKEEEEEENEATKLSLTVMGIILLLVGMTITFEIEKERLEESVDRNTRPIIASLFGELTVLGFLSMFTFLITKLGVIDVLTLAIFGEEGAEDNILLETFEEVHYMLFIIMVSFVFSVIILVQDAKTMENKWFIMNMVCAKSTSMSNAADLLEEVQYEMIQRTKKHITSSSSSWIFHFLRENFFFCFDGNNKLSKYSNKPEHNDITSQGMYLFSELRKEFILDRNLNDSPFEPIPKSTVSEDFNYARYLSLCFGKTLGHAVDLSYVTWGFFALLTMIYFGILMLMSQSKETFPWVWVGSAWLFIFISSFISHHILQILHQMIPELPRTGVSATTNVVVDESNTLLSSSSLPAWSKIALSEEEAKRTTRQESLYWTKRYGPFLYLVLFQIQLIFISAYISLLVVMIYPNIFGSKLWSTQSSIIYIIASLIPFLLLLRTFPNMAWQMTIACNIGVHQRPQIVSQVIRMEKTDHLIHSMIILQKMQNIGEKGGLSLLKENKRTNVDNSTDSWNSVGAVKIQHYSTRKDLMMGGRGSMHMEDDQISAVGKIFDNFDKSGDGSIDSTELENLLKSLGQEPTKESLETILSLLDCNGDGEISREEFILFYSEFILAGLNAEDMDTMVEQLFSQFDLDQSGSITLSEFVEVIDGLNVGFTIDEISELINEMDGHESTYDGSISIHEFRSLLDAHRHLFDHQMARRR